MLIKCCFLTRYLEKLEDEQDINEEMQTTMEKELHIPVTLNVWVYLVMKIIVKVVGESLSYCSVFLLCIYHIKILHNNVRYLFSTYTVTHCSRCCTMILTGGGEISYFQAVCVYNYDKNEISFCIAQVLQVAQKVSQLSLKTTTAKPNIHLSVTFINK